MRRSAAASRAVAFAVAALSLASCAARQPASPAAVFFDTDSGFLKRVEVRVPKDDPVVVDAAHFDFLVVIDGRYSTFWNATAIAHDGVRDATVALTPRRAEASPTIGAALVVRAVDQRTGASTTLGSTTIAKDFGDLLDRRLAYFTSFPTYIVGGWQVLGSFPEGGNLRPIATAPRGVAVALRGQSLTEWNDYTLFQDVALDKVGTFDVLVRPTHDCDGDTAAPTNVSGISLGDASGHVAQYCISPRVRARLVNQFAGGMQVITVVPGRLGAWNRLRVSLAEVAPFFKLYANPAGNVRLSLGVKFHARPGDRVPPSDVESFSDIRLDPKRAE